MWSPPARVVFNPTVKDRLSSLQPPPSHGGLVSMGTPLARVVFNPTVKDRLFSQYYTSSSLKQFHWLRSWLMTQIHIAYIYYTTVLTEEIGVLTKRGILYYIQSTPLLVMAHVQCIHLLYNCTVKEQEVQGQTKSRAVKLGPGECFSEPWRRISEPT